MAVWVRAYKNIFIPSCAWIPKKRKGKRHFSIQSEIEFAMIQLFCEKLMFHDRDYDCA